MIRDETETARMKVTPPLAVAPLEQEVGILQPGMLHTQITVNSKMQTGLR